MNKNINSKEKMQPSKGFLYVLPWELKHLGGVNQVVKSCISEMQSQGRYNAHLLVCSWDAKKGYHYIDNGLSTFTMRLHQLGANFLSFRKHLSFLYGLPKELSELHKYIQKNNIRVINVHYPERTSVIFSIYKRLMNRNIKLIVSLHGSDVKTLVTESKFARLQWRFIFENCNSIVPCSADLGNILKKTVSVNESKIQVIHNAINPSYIMSQQTKGQSVYHSSKLFIISIGTLDQNKGHDLTIKAYSLLSDDLKSKFNLLILGKYTSFAEILKEQIKDLNCQDNIFIKENVMHADVIATLNKASLFILASRSEGFPLVLLEAGFLSVPVIASKVGGIPELINHGINGYLFQKGNSEQLSECVNELLINEKDRVSLLTRNLFSDIKKKTWKVVYRKYISLIK